MYKFLLIIITLLSHFNVLAKNNIFSVIKTDSNKIILSVNLPQNSSVSWKYPGQLGEKTEIKLDSLENLKSYEIFWPFPKKTTIAEKYLSYYYDGNFEIPIILEPKFKDKQIQFSVSIKGVLCRDNQCEKINENIENITINPTKYIEKAYHPYPSNPFEFKIKSIEILNNEAVFKVQFIKNLIDKWPDFVVEPTKKMFLGFGEVKAAGKIGAGEFVWKAPLLKGYEDYIGQDFTIYSNQNYDSGMKFKFQATKSYDYSFIYDLILPLFLGFILNIYADPKFLGNIIQDVGKYSDLKALKIFFLTFVNFISISLLAMIFNYFFYFIGLFPTYINIILIGFIVAWAFYSISKDKDIIPKSLFKNIIKLSTSLGQRLFFISKYLQFKKLFIAIFIIQIILGVSELIPTMISSFLMTLGFLAKYFYNKLPELKLKLKIEKQYLGYSAVFLFVILCFWLVLSSNALYSNDTTDTYSLVQYKFVTSFLSNSAFYLFFIAFLAGLILNFMPCVLPVLSLKIISILKDGDKVDNKAKLIATISGILFTFLILALFSVILKFFGLKFGLGMTFQQPYFVITIILTITFFICALLDQINITLPNIIINSMVKTKFNSEIAHSFFLGVLATILSTPCTAPFLGTVLFFAITESALVNISLFLIIGLGFSFPYILLLLFPKTLNFLPKPGPWMIKLKSIMAILLICTIIWLLNVLYTQLGIRAAIITGLMIALIKYFLGVKELPFLQKYRISINTAKQIILSVLVVLTFYLPYHTKYEDNLIDYRINASWQNFDEKLLHQLLEENKVVFIDVTADWCVTCVYNKIFLLDRDHFLNLLKSNNVVAMRGDMTLDSDPTIGKFLEENQKYAIPFNIVYGPGAKNGIELPVLLSYNDVKNAIEIAKGN